MAFVVGGGVTVPSVQRPVSHHCVPGLGRLPGEDLVVVRRAPPLDPAGTFGGDHGPGRQLREHADRGGQLRQDHPRLVPSYLCPRGCATGAQRIHYLPTGKGTHLARGGRCKHLIVSIYSRILFIRTICIDEFVV